MTGIIKKNDIKHFLWAYDAKSLSIPHGQNSILLNRSAAAKAVFVSSLPRIALESEMVLYPCQNYAAGLIDVSTMFLCVVV